MNKSCAKKKQNVKQGNYIDAMINFDFFKTVFVLEIDDTLQFNIAIQ